jgi:hypothetical protein
MSDPRVKAFDFASDLCKQLITLATGILAVTITFSKDLVGPASSTAKDVLSIAWGVYLLSIVAGIGTLMSLTGTLGKSAQPSIYSGKATAFAKCQITLFLVGVGLTILFGVCAFGPASGSPQPIPTPKPSVSAPPSSSSPPHVSPIANPT